jgi:gliding motility-associated-like protein
MLLKQLKLFPIQFGIAVFVFIGTQGFSQENTLEHYIHYSAYDQNMWGPDDSYAIDVEYDFFDVTIDESWGFSEVTEVFGEEFGVGFETGIFAYLRSSFEAHGFSTGSFDLDYPVIITLDFPEDYSFNYGGPATIHTSYIVTDGWDLSTEFPPVGITTLDLEYEFNPFMDIIFCVFGCDTVHLIPTDIQVPHTIDTLFHINAYTEYAIYPCFENGDFQFCHDYDLPIEFSDWFDIGLTAFVTLPYVETTDYIDTETNCLIAHGDSLYMNVNIDIIHFLHSMAGLIPPPDGETIQQALEFLSDTIEYPIETPIGDINAVIAYELLSAHFDTYNYMHQQIEFCPTIWANLSFPVEMPYEITDPNNGNSIYETGNSDTISVPVGHDLTITYPCHDWDSMYVGVEYDITPTIRNHTYDSIAFVLTIDALSVSINIETPFKEIIPPDTLPRFSLPSIEQNDSVIFASEIYTTGLKSGQDALNEAKDIGPFEIGPLFSWEIPLGHTDLTWFDQTWEMENFIQDTVFPGTYIRPYDKSELLMNVYVPLGSYCFGDTANHIYGQVTDDLAPLTYYWSTGEIHTGIMNGLDSVYVSPGYYSVTVSDEYGCTTEDDINVQTNPPIINTMLVSDILCHGENTGTITAQTSGGTAPFSYDWSYEYTNDGLNQNVANNLPPGWHYVTITDWFGCTESDSAYISEPPTALELSYTSQGVSCYGDNNGSIQIQLSGATPPYQVLWNTGSTTTQLNHLTGGIYTVTVTDFYNCELVEQIEVYQPDSLIAYANTSMVQCYDASDAYIAIHPEGGTPPYQYMWFHYYGETSDSIANLPPGLYMCTVTDSNSCRDTISQFITQPDSLGVYVNTGEPSCHGFHDGWLSVETFGGIPPYTLEWDDYATNLDTIPLLGTGVYSLSVTDSNGCNLVEEISISEPENLYLEFNNIQHISCFGLEDGSVIAEVSGGTQAYNYLWDNSVSHHNDSLAYQLDAGITYGVTIVDANNCSTQGNISLTEPELLEISGHVNPVECGLNSGSGEVQADGGTPPYQYNWSNGESIPNAINLPSGIVSVSVTDSNSCQDSTIFTVDKIGEIHANAEIISDILCYGDSSATATATIVDGFEPFEFQWKNRQDFHWTGDSITNLPSGSYTIYASDRLNCFDTVYLQINEPDSIHAGLEITKPSCSAEYDGSIKSETFGGTPPYSYLWSNGSSESSINNIRDGFYSLTIIDYNACNSEININLEESEYCLIIHNTITPNEDGKNDVWIVENIEYFPFSKVWIFNRNGIEVYYNEAYQNNWGGTYKDKNLPEGTYYYIIDLGNGKEMYKGYITIIR